MPYVDALKAALSDRYEFVRELGRGGFAVVWLARDLRHDRQVALKVIHEEVAESVGRERFEREVKLVARLQHPHILGVFDSGEVDGRLWFTMPFIVGETLRTRIERERQLPLADAVRIATEVADALDYAHAAGVIHRDIKPENILLSGRHALVADFGIARAIGAAKQSSLTMTGMGIGTPGYMSPEQALGMTNIDVRTDVYALGCVLYEMLAGEAPFAGPTPQAVIARVMSEDPRPLATTRPGLPTQLESVIRKAMARVTADRFGSAQELATALAQAVQGAVTISGDVVAPSLTVRPAPRRLLPAIAAAAVVVLGLAGWFGVRAVRHAGGPPALAVLPFESIGTAEDATFADGITEEVRGKLAGVPGLRVIARASSNQYRDSPKSPRAIGSELGVRYLLTGTVRWSDGRDGRRRVRVTPELIDASDGSTRWQEPFDDELMDVFAVQSAIAQNVATALDVALSAETRSRIVERPTEDLPAYREFLLGESATQAMVAIDRQSLDEGLRHYSRAVALDSTYADAWARIAEINVARFETTYSRDDVAGAQEALALAGRRAPKSPLVMIGRAQMASSVDKDFDRAAAILDTVVRQNPNDAPALAYLARAEAVLARWDDAIAHSRRAAELDPRNPRALSSYARVLHGTRRFAEADSVFARLLALSPGNIAVSEIRVINLMSMGDTATARRVIHETLQHADTNQLISYYALYQEMMWTLPIELQRRLVTLGPEVFLNNRQQWALKVGRQWAMLGDTARAHAYGDTAVAMATAQVAQNPNDAQLFELMARSLALAGRRAEAIRYAERSLARGDTERSATTINYVRYQAMRVFLQAGEYDRALDLLEPLLTAYYSDLSPAWVRLDPVFQPLRGNARFERLVERR